MVTTLHPPNPSLVAVFSIHATAEEDAVWRRTVFPVYHTTGWPVRMALCSGGHGPLLHQWHGSTGAPGPHTGPIHHIHVLDRGTFKVHIHTGLTWPTLKSSMIYKLWNKKKNLSVILFNCFSGFCALPRASVQDVEGDRPEGAAADPLAWPHHSQPTHPVHKYTLQSHQQRDYGVGYFLQHGTYLRLCFREEKNEVQNSRAEAGFEDSLKRWRTVTQPQSQKQLHQRSKSQTSDLSLCYRDENWNQELLKRWMLNHLQ